MKVVNWILTVLSYLSIPAVFLIWLIEGKTDPWLNILIIGITLFLILGFIAHNLSSKYFFENHDGKLLFIITFPPFIIPFIIFGIIYLILYIINKLCWYFTDRYLISEFLYWFKKTCLGIRESNNIDTKNSVNETEKVIIVLYHGYERHLKLVESYCTDHAIHGKIYKNVIGTDKYNKYVDEYNNYWRSYDKDKTFVMEADLIAQGYNLG